MLETRLRGLERNLGGGNGDLYSVKDTDRGSVVGGLSGRLGGQHHSLRLVIMTWSACLRALSISYRDFLISICECFFL